MLCTHMSSVGRVQNGDTGFFAIRGRQWLPPSKNAIEKAKVYRNFRKMALRAIDEDEIAETLKTQDEAFEKNFSSTAVRENESVISRISPSWLTQLGRLWGKKSEIPVVNAKPQDFPELLQGALFKPLFRWMNEYGKVYLLPTGPVSSFLVISDPQIAKHMLRYSDHVSSSLYDKGLVAEVSQFLFGDGLAMAKGNNWKSRRRAIAPAFHKAYLTAMIKNVFGPSALYLASKLERAAETGISIDMEQMFSQMTLDVVGKAVFNYDFDSLSKDSDLIQAVYVALKETEKRATDLLPIWKIPLAPLLFPRYRIAERAVKLIRETTEELINKCKEMVEREESQNFSEEYLNDSDPSILRFLIASREQVSAIQLRDDLLSMLVAGHETTASTLTWTLYLLQQNPEKLKKAQEEADRIVTDCESINFENYQELRYISRCVSESLRLYPHPPVLIRRALETNEAPGGYKISKNQDILISVYNIHHSSDLWEDAELFLPERFDINGPMPNELNTDFKFIPFSGGPRKCIGDQFAMMEAVVTLAIILKKFKFTLSDPTQEINITTGATIHTTSGLFMNIQKQLTN